MSKENTVLFDKAIRDKEDLKKRQDGARRRLPGWRALVRGGLDRSPEPLGSEFDVVLFSDVRNLTTLSESRTSKRWSRCSTSSSRATAAPGERLLTLCLDRIAGDLVDPPPLAWDGTFTQPEK